MCSGYYSYAAGYKPDVSCSTFHRRIAHPQDGPTTWTTRTTRRGDRQRSDNGGTGAGDSGGSGARDDAAALADLYGRSPVRGCGGELSGATICPPRLRITLARLQIAAANHIVYALARRQPERAKRVIIRRAQKQLPPGYDVATHFTPRYRPFGSAALPGARRRKSRPSGRARPAWSPGRSRHSPSVASSWSPARSWRQTLS